MTAPGVFKTDLPKGVAFKDVRTRPLSRAPAWLENGQLVFDVKGPEKFVVEFGTGRPQLQVFGFSTKYPDREVGLVAHQLRTYNSGHGRWISQSSTEDGMCDCYMPVEVK